MIIIIETFFLSIDYYWIAKFSIHSVKSTNAFHMRKKMDHQQMTKNEGQLMGKIIKLLMHFQFVFICETIFFSNV